MERSLFGGQFQRAQALLAGVSDPVKLIELTANVSRAVYESESHDLALLRRSSGFSPALLKMEQEFERIRYEMQEVRVRALFSAKRARPGLSLEEARRILWMYTSRDVHRMLVQEERLDARPLSRVAIPNARRGAHPSATLSADCRSARPVRSGAALDSGTP